MTQEQLASAATALAGTAISQAAISALEKRNSESTTWLFALAKALKINPEWLQTGTGISGLEADAWRADPENMPSDERELLANYRAASKRWRLSLVLLSRLKADAKQDEAAEGVNLVMAKIAMDPVPDSKLGTAWTRPDRRKVIEPVRSQADGKSDAKDKKLGG